MTRDTSHGNMPFGQALRAKRLERRIGLRRFAELVGVSPTYLSRVEQCNVDPPTAERVRRMAELLDENVDEWSALAGRVPNDLQEMIQTQPGLIPALLRAVKGLTEKQLQSLIDRAVGMKRDSDS